jgi:diaminopimelate epimerase
MNLLLRPSWYRAHGLGNDYLVFEAAPAEAVPSRAAPSEAAHAEPGANSWPANSWPLTRRTVQRVCHRGEGLGSDGIVVLLDPSPSDGVFPLRMFNPDGSEFERSGNGLRILGAYLVQRGLVDAPRFSVRSGGSLIEMAQFSDDAATSRGEYDLSVAMGQAKIGPDALGWIGAPADHPPYLNLMLPSEPGIQVLGVSVGNPHAVVLGTGDGRWPAEVALDGPLLNAIGPALASHPQIPRGTNVQLARVHPEGGLEIGIWERGVGRTSASGTSACAATVALVASGQLEPGTHTVRMPGGHLTVSVTATLEVVLRGPVQEVATGDLTEGFVASLRAMDDRG